MMLVLVAVIETTKVLPMSAQSLCDEVECDKIPPKLHVRLVGRLNIYLCS